MWTYTGLEDEMRYSNSEMTTEEFKHRMKVITSVTCAVQMTGQVHPLDHRHPPTLVCSE